MNLKAKLDKIAKRPRSADAVPLSSLAPMSEAKVRARSVEALRRHMKAKGRSDAEVDAYLAEQDHVDAA